MKRRQILLAFTTLPIAACTQTTAVTEPPAVVVSPYARDVDLVISGLRSILPYIASSTVVVRYNVYLDKLDDLAKRMLAAQDANSSKSAVQQILAVAGEALQVVATITLPGSGNIIVSAIQTLLPIIAVGIGIVGMRTRPTGMTPEQARMTLARVR